MKVCPEANSVAVVPEDDIAAAACDFNAVSLACVSIGEVAVVAVQAGIDFKCVREDLIFNFIRFNRGTGAGCFLVSRLSACTAMTTVMDRGLVSKIENILVGGRVGGEASLSAGKDEGSATTTPDRPGVSQELVDAGTGVLQRSN